MRLASALLFALATLGMAVAAYAGDAVWRQALAAAVVLATLFVLALVAAILETVAPQRALGLWAAEGLVAEVTAVVLSRLSPLGKLPEHPLLDLTHSGLSLGGLGLCVGGVVLALAALRSRGAVPAILSGLSLLGALFALGSWVAKLS